MLIFTDGSYSRKPNMAGLGVVILYRDRQVNIGRYDNRCIDNNVAEIAAIALAIQYIKNNKIIDKVKNKTINIISDSSYAIRKLNRIDSNGRDKFEQNCLDFIRNFLDETNKKVSFLQIKGHTHDGTKYSYYNNIADQIAGEERLKGLERQKLFINKKMRKYRD